MSDRIARMGRELQVNVVPLVIFAVGVIVAVIVGLVC